MALQHLRSSTANKRPTPAAMAEGQMAINTESTSPGLFFKNSAGALVKVGPVHVGTTAPNASPASGGETGNSVGEQWLDTSGSTYVFKVWDGTAWRSEAGEFVNTSGDTMTGALGIIAGTAAAPGIFVSGDPNTGIYSPGADQVAISTNGTGRLFVDAAGSVGIGKTPSYALDVVGSIQITNAQAIRALNSTGTSYRLLTPGGDDNLYLGGNEANSNEAIIFRANDSERMRLDSSGRLGLGTSSPSDKLTVADGNLRVNGSNSSPVLLTVAANASATGGVNRCSVDFIDAAGTGGCVLRAAHDGGFFDLRTRVAGVETPRIAVEYGTGRVGIGVTAPSEALDVSGVIRRTNTGSAGYYFRGYRSSTTSAFYIYDDGTDIQLTNEQSGALQFRTANAERARIDSSGRLLIGTSTEIWGNRFEVVQTANNGNIGALRYTANANGVEFNFIKSRGATAGTNTIVVDFDELARINFKGADGSSYIDAARIVAAVDGTPGTNDMPGRLVFSTTADGASSPSERVRIDSAGAVCIGVTFATPGVSNTNAGAAIKGNGQAYFSATSDTTVFVNRNTTDGAAVSLRREGTQVGSISVTTTATAYNTSSDYRLKENVAPLTGAIDRVNQLQVHRFNFIADPGKTVDGFIAHEAQAVVPECVTGTKDEVDDEGNPVYQGIDQSKLVPLLTAALQEALQKIEDLEARLTAAGI